MSINITSFGLGRYPVGVIAAVAMLAGCGGSQPPAGAPGAMPLNVAHAKLSDRDGSWMLPAAKNENLLYLSAPFYNNVFVVA